MNMSKNSLYPKRHLFVQSTNVLRRGFILFMMVLWWYSSLYAFPPKDEESFVNNCLRLLNTRQYSFLTQYFIQYYPEFKEQKNVGYIRDIVMRIPFADQKEEILRVYINNATSVAPFAYDLFGQLKLFQTNYTEVVKAYLRYDRPERFYYLGFAEKQLGNLNQAKDHLLEAVKVIENPELVESAYLLIAEINIVQKNYTDARKALRKVPTKNYRKWITYYYLYESDGNRAFLERVTEMIRGFPKDDPVVNEFLEKEKLQR